jgi:hypothetical protein
MNGREAPIFDASSGKSKKAKMFNILAQASSWSWKKYGSIHQNSACPTMPGATAQRLIWTYSDSFSRVSEANQREAAMNSC